VFGHGFLFNRGEKMSKSTGNVVDPFVMADHYGVDAMRYFFLREVSFGQDGSYNHEAIVSRINADLANDLGNLAQRSLSMIGKHTGGAIPDPGAFTDDDLVILETADDLIDQCRAAMDSQALHIVLATIWKAVGDANRYFAAQEPWVLRKSDPARMATVLYVTAEVIRQIAILTQPVMPAASAKLLDLLAVAESKRSFATLGSDGRLAARVALPQPQPVFPRYVEAEETVVT
jgi:methionyl-tRNA synthetase